MAANADFADRLELFFGDASDAVCRVYARLRGPEATQGFQLRGNLTGPTCRYGQTLPAKFAFADRGPGDSLVAEAIVPEPCFWTPDMPHLYEAHVQLVRDGQEIDRAKRQFGIRPLGTHGQKLIYDAARWVLRGVLSAESTPTDLADWRDCGAALVIDCPEDALCEEASRVGVLVVARLEARQVSKIRRLAHWPAVGIVVLPSGIHLDLHGLRLNLLLAEHFPVGEPLVPQPWARVAFCEVGEPADAISAFLNCPVAVIAARPAGELSSVAEGRALCDRLQRDLAIAGQGVGSSDPAGYIV